MDPLRGTRAALLFALVVAVLDILLGDTEQTYLAPLLIAAPAMAAGAASPAGVAVVGAVVLAVRYLLAIYDNVLSETGDTRIFAIRTVGYVAVTAAAMALAARRQRGESKLRAVTSVALAAQHAILRDLPAAVTDVRVGLRYVSAADEALIGGDLYDVAATPYGTRILIGDVKGSGLGAVYAASIVLGAFRALAYDEPDLAELGRRVESTVYRHLAADDFITALFLQVGADDVTVLHRGHVPPLVVRPDRTVATLDTAVPGPPLGFGHLVDTRPAPWSAAFKEGDTLVLYTDGVVEARGEGGFYPLTRRVVALVDGDLDASAGRLHADLLRHTGRALTDDAVLLLVARNPLL
ncbi:membrane protein [Longispora fulva]|uniref:Serine phosphatase RsbU (Regulator of sigma subunit) n=1 Tax=Longispora fulva TaxID=619741 RepID=A0A8J7GEE6_9ACTN|nr:PP2C family protein-serine/threonine phosphatase [Longispora fulva]MBG6137184.1 serine phosphatase RsbU (regulator of sigma subunit) [Longispora fulva]GIG61462.1 membrane protein [Longispora fulva]